MSRTQVQLWYNRFKEGRDVNDDFRPGRLRTSTTDENLEAVKKTILHNRRIVIRLLTYRSAYAKQFLRMF